MRIHLVTGGVRSGKSRFAQEQARQLGGDEVTVIATAEPGDEEMAARIAAHRAARPSEWETIETTGGVGQEIAAAGTDVVLLECVTMLCANALHAGGEDRIAREVDAVLGAAAERDGDLVVVTNEVGLGVVPPTRAGRAFRDALGAANRRIAERAEDVVLMVSGLPLWLKGSTG